MVTIDTSFVLSSQVQFNNSRNGLLASYHINKKGQLWFETKKHDDIEVGTGSRSLRIPVFFRFNPIEHANHSSYTCGLVRWVTGNDGTPIKQTIVSNNQHTWPRSPDPMMEFKLDNDRHLCSIGNLSFTDKLYSIQFLARMSGENRDQRLATFTVKRKCNQSKWHLFEV